MRQQLPDPACALRRQPCKYIPEIGIWVVPIEFGRTDQAHHCDGPLAGPKRFGKQPVRTANGKPRQSRQGWSEHAQATCGPLGPNCHHRRHGQRRLLAPPRTAVNELIFNSLRVQGLPAPKLSITTYSMQLLNSGQYLTALPVSAVRFNAARWSLKALPITIGNDLPVSVVTLKSRIPTPVVQLFLDRAKLFYVNDR